MEVNNFLFDYLDTDTMMIAHGNHIITTKSHKEHDDICRTIVKFGYIREEEFKNILKADGDFKTEEHFQQEMDNGIELGLILFIQVDEEYLYCLNSERIEDVEEIIAEESKENKP